MRRLLLSTFYLSTSIYIQAQPVLISSQSFESNPPIQEMTYKVTGTGGNATGYSGMSPTTYYVAESPFYVEGSKGFGINNSTRYIDFDPVNTNSYTQIKLNFKLAAFASTNNQGLDQTDKVTVLLSTDGVDYYPQICITGNNNSYWPYAAEGIASAAYVAGGNTETFKPANSGGLRMSDGLGTVEVTNLPASPNLFVRIEVITNRNDEIWLVDNVQLIGQMVSLPVELVQFNIKKEGKQQRLNWVTARENNVEAFVIECSKTGSQFFPVGIIEAIGAGGYTYLDEKPMNGISYYRLKIMDYNGDISYSKVETAYTGSNKWSLFPTLAQEYVVLESSEPIENLKNGAPSVEVYDMAGRQVLTLSLENGNSSIRVPLNNLLSGVYFIKVKDWSQKFVKQ